MRSYDTFEDAHRNDILRLQTELENSKISADLIAKICSSGYYISEFKPDYVLDSFYGTTEAFIGAFSKSHFIDLARGKENEFQFRPETHYISKIGEIADILSARDRDKFYFEQGLLSFRGQRKEYTITRPYPNPTIANSLAVEPLVIPSVWRKYYPDFNKRIISGEFKNFFGTLIADELIYYGIEDWQTLGERNFHRYGMHTLSDLEDFPDAESQEYYRRWRDFKIFGDYNPELALVAQHYGIETLGVDITFNPKIAGFFASNEFVTNSNGKSDYTPIQEGKHEGVIYCFYFRTPTVAKTRDLIMATPTFGHLKPSRPIVQECAMPFFQYDRMNKAYMYVYKIFYLSKDFDASDIQDKRVIFPDKSQDAFYKVICDIRKHNEYFQAFTEFEFE